MPIRCLGFTTYDRSGYKSKYRKIHNPTWDQIVESIKRLDRFCSPFVFLFNGDNDVDPTVDCLSIMGGEGVYWVALSSGEHDQLRLYNPDAESDQDEIEIWTSDQGFSDFECHITRDIELIFRIAKHFAETGQPLTEAQWESR